MMKQKKPEVSIYQKDAQQIEIAPNDVHDINKILQNIQQGLKICTNLKILCIKFEIRMSDVHLEKIADSLLQCQLCEKIILLSQKCGEYQPQLNKFFSKLANLKNLKSFSAQFLYKQAKNYEYKISQLKNLREVDISFDFNLTISIEKEKKNLINLAKQLSTLKQLNYLNIYLGKFDIGKHYFKKELSDLCNDMKKLLIKNIKMYSQKFISLLLIYMIWNTFQMNQMNEQLQYYFHSQHKWLINSFVFKY